MLGVFNCRMVCGVAPQGIKVQCAFDFEGDVRTTEKEDWMVWETPRRRRLDLLSISDLTIINFDGGNPNGAFGGN